MKLHKSRSSPETIIHPESCEGVCHNPNPNTGPNSFPIRSPIPPSTALTTQSTQITKPRTEGKVFLLTPLLGSKRAGDGDLDLGRADIDSFGTGEVGHTAVLAFCDAVDVGRAGGNPNVRRTESSRYGLGRPVNRHPLVLQGVGGTHELNYDRGVAPRSDNSALGGSCKAGAGQESGGGESEELHFDGWKRWFEKGIEFVCSYRVM